MVWWPVTVGARATALVPEYWRATTAEDAKLVRALSTPRLLPEVEKKFPGFRERFLVPFKDDITLTDIAVHILETVQPHLLLLHMAQVDHWQHEHGPMSAQALHAIEIADQQIARLIEAAKKTGLWESTVVVVLSDHGFLPTTKQLWPGVWLRQKGMVRLDADGRVMDWKAIVVANSGSAYIYVKDPNDEATKSALLQMFRAREGQAGSGIARVFQNDQIVAMGGDPNAFLALEAQNGFAFKAGYSGEAIREVPLRGEHGYPHDREAMRAALLIYGPPIGQGKIEAVRAIDIGPTIAAWLELPFGHAEGKPLLVPRHNTGKH
jgi:predicted AlkP superfamily pyrophosphatase or phosphodiesterase